MMFTLPGSQVAAGKQVLELEALRLAYAPMAPLNWRMDGPMRVALRAPTAAVRRRCLKRCWAWSRRFQDAAAYR